MIEALAILGLVVIIWLSFSFFKFIEFKSKLMNAFEQNFVDYDTANSFYTQHAEFVNSLYSSSHSPMEIANEYIRRFPEVLNNELSNQEDD